MEIIDQHERDTRLAFAKRAARAFKRNPVLESWSANGIQAGELLALRWDDARGNVLVLRVDQFYPIEIHTRLYLRESTPTDTNITIQE